tara:strand:- start:32 stop:1579 length:1548 start_codon:yes stop_codon:yes gene_type:complete
MSFRQSMSQLRPARKPKVDLQEKVHSFLTETSLSKAQLEKPAGKGPNDGIARIIIFANKITKGEEHMRNDGSTIKIKEITMNDKVYGVKDMKKLVKDFDDVKTFQITKPPISISAKADGLAKTPEYGGEGGGTKIHKSTQELMTAAIVLAGTKYDSTEISVKDAKKIIGVAKKQWGNIVGVIGKEALLNQFTDNWYDLATAISSANAILKMIGKPTKVFWTGQKWDEEIAGFNPPIGNIKDYNSSDIVVASGKKYYGFSLKKKKQTKDADPTLINKPITGNKSFLKDFLSKADMDFIERAKQLFFKRMLLAYPPFKKKNPKGAFSLIQKMSNKDFKRQIGKIPNKFANEMLAGRGAGGKRNIFWRVVDKILRKDPKEMMTAFLKLVFRVDLQPILDQTGNFEFYLLTGIGQKKGDAIGVEPAEVKDLPTTIEALTKIFQQDNLKLGATLDNQGKTKSVPWEYDGTKQAPAKMFYTLYNGKLPLVNLDIRYKGSKTAEPQFQATATPIFKNMMSGK